MAPNPKLLHDDRLVTDGVRPSGCQHPVQQRHVDGRLVLLGREPTGTQPWSDQRLVSSHCRLHQGPLTVPGRSLPGQAALFLNHGQMAVALWECQKPGAACCPCKALARLISPRWASRLPQVFDTPLAELRAAARAQEGAGGQARAALLRALSTKVEAALRPGTRRRVAPDLDALTLAEGDAMQAGPRPLADAAVLATLRDAIKARALLRFHYEGKARAASPWGLLYGRSYYLVGPGIGLPDPVLWRLDRINGARMDGPAPQSPPPGWTMGEYAARSFGVFQERPRAIVLRFSAAAAPDAARFLFHPSQVLTPEPDGSLLVRFTAGGLLEMVRHLFTWGPEVTILAPAALRNLMLAELAGSLAHHARAGQS